MLNLTLGLRRDPPLVRTISVVRKRYRGRAGLTAGARVVQCVQGSSGNEGRRHWGRLGMAVGALDAAEPGLNGTRARGTAVPMADNGLERRWAMAQARAAGQAESGHGTAVKQRH